MANTIIGYANYGVTGAEKVIVFTVSNPHAYATCSDKVKIVLPEGYAVRETESADIVIDTPHGTYTADEILSSRNGEPGMRWYDGRCERFVKCEWAKI